jgi:hypothetical protein
LELKEGNTALQLQTHLDDVWTYIWNGGAFSSKQVTAFFKVLTRFLLYSNGCELLKCKISISSSFGSSSRI